jgi:hypothetical protein
LHGTCVPPAAVAGPDGNAARDSPTPTAAATAPDRKMIFIATTPSTLDGDTAHHRHQRDCRSAGMTHRP